MYEAGDAQKLRTRARQMLELANRAYCEKHYDFARLLTLLATEAFEHASEMEQQRQSQDRSAV
jgi:NTP pyrophosphatase (non-canonical NTP hydrolase)